MLAAITLLLSLSWAEPAGNKTGSKWRLVIRLGKLVSLFQGLSPCSPLSNFPTLDALAQAHPPPLVHVTQPQSAQLLVVLLMETVLQDLGFAVRRISLS